MIGQLERLARQHKTTKDVFVRPDRGRRRLGLRLAGIWIGDRRDQRADAGGRRIGLAPVDRRKQHAALLPGTDHDLERAFAMIGGDAGERSIGEAMSRRVVGMHLDERLRQMRTQTAGLMPVRVMVCHWSRMRPVFNRSGRPSLISVRNTGRSGATKRPLRSLVKNSPPAKNRLLPGLVCAMRPQHRRHRVEAVIAHRAQAADIEIAAAIILERRERRMLAKIAAAEP